MKWCNMTFSDGKKVRHAAAFLIISTGLISHAARTLEGYCSSHERCCNNVQLHATNTNEYKMHWINKYVQSL